MEKNDIKIVKPFGPSVVIAKIPVNTVETLNKYIDGIVADKKKSADLNHGHKLVGDVTQEFKLEKEIIEKSGWGKFLVECVSKWMEIEMKTKMTKFELLTTWVVRQFENEYNPTHTHSGHISGAGFLKLPKSFGEHKQKKTHTSYSGGNLQLIHGSKMFMCESTLDIKPEVGDLYLFPNYLMHAVFPFKDSKEERRSISFNALIDESIYNAYE